VGQLWSKIIGYVVEGSARAFLDLLGGRVRSDGLIGDLGAWQRGWWRSLMDDPVWHSSWTVDVARKWGRLQSTLWTAANPRVRGLTCESPS
jgi:hypothetical protein